MHPRNWFLNPNWFWLLFLKEKNKVDSIGKRIFFLQSFNRCQTLSSAK